MNACLIYRKGFSHCRKCLLLQNAGIFSATRTRRVLSSIPSAKNDFEPPGGGGREGPAKIEKFAYGTDQFAKRKRDSPGLFYLSTVHLPKQLDRNIKEYLKRYPKKILDNDGKKIASHLRNRGRPTEATWNKYKESRGARKARDPKGSGTTEDILKLKDEQKQQTKTQGEYNLEDGEHEHESDDDADASDDSDHTDSVNSISGEESPVDSEQVSDASLENSTVKTALKTKKPKREEYKVIRYENRESAAFAASRIPAGYGATLRVLHEISRREPSFNPETLMDFGSGTGTVVWAAHNKWGDSLKEYQCIDISEHMNSLSEFLLRGGESFRKPLHIPCVYFKRFLPVSNKVTYDIVIASYTLSEIPHASLRKEAMRSLWAKTNDFLVIIEYGNNEGFEILLEARKMVEMVPKGLDKAVNTELVDEQNQTTEEGISTAAEHPEEDLLFEANTVEKGFVFSPCPHDSSCPRSNIETRDHPCNFEQQVQLSFVEKNTKLRKWGYVTERFSYVVLRKGEREMTEKAWPRILEPVKLRGRHVICKLCCSSGTLEQKIITKKKDSDIYKCVRHLSRWGDLMPVPDDRIRPLKNPEITVTRKGKQRK